MLVGCLPNLQIFWNLNVTQTDRLVLIFIPVDSIGTFAQRIPVDNPFSLHFPNGPVCPWSAACIACAEEKTSSYKHGPPCPPTNARIKTANMLLWFSRNKYINYRPQRSWGKVIFSQASVILLTGGCLLWGVWSRVGACSGRVSGPRGCLLLGGVPAPGGSAPEGCLVEIPPGRPLLRVVRILLECILVNLFISLL